MIPRRLIACLDLRADRVVKGVNFESLRDQGDPIALAARAEAEGADELVILDIGGATGERCHDFLATVRRITRDLAVPVTIGGGIRTIDDVARALDAGATKVSINSAAVRNPALLLEAAGRFGSERVVASIDAKLVDGEFRIFTHGGRSPTDLDAISWARECADRGAGEILVTSIDRDGRRDGFDLPLIRLIADAVATPVIASGGAGSAAHFRDLFSLTNAAAGLAAGIFHDGTTTPGAVKEYLARAGVAVHKTGMLG